MLITITIIIIGPGSLNRQFIRVLSCLGISDNTFLELQNEAILYYKSSYFTSPLLTLQILLRSQRDTFEEKTACDLLYAGFDFSEPYLCHLLSIIVKSKLTKMRDKASILILKSRNVLMIPDPSGALDEGTEFLITCYQEISSTTCL